MAPKKNRVTVREYSEVAPYYGPFLRARKNGKVGLELFWGLVRHQLRTQLLDAVLERSYVKLVESTLARPTTASVKLRLEFRYIDDGTAASCNAIAERFHITSGQAVKLLLIASSEISALSGLIAEQSLGSSCQKVPIRDASPTLALEISSVNVIQPAEKTRFCEETQTWLIFRPARLDKSMTQKQLMEVHTWGGLYLPMTLGESEARGLTPRHVVVAPVTESDCDDSHDALYAGAAGYSADAQAAVRTVVPQPSKPVEAQSDISMARQLAGMQSMLHVFEKLAGKS